MKQTAKYLARYYNEDTSFYVLKLSDKSPTTKVRLDSWGVVGEVDVDEEGYIVGFPAFLKPLSINELLTIFNSFGVKLVSVDMLPLYKLPEVENGVYMCASDGQQFYV